MYKKFYSSHLFLKNQIFSLFSIVKMNANYTEISFVQIFWISQYSCETSVIQTNPSLAKHDMPCFSKQCRSRSVGFWRSQLIWICTVIKYVNLLWSLLKVVMKYLIFHRLYFNNNFNFILSYLWTPSFFGFSFMAKWFNRLSISWIVFTVCSFHHSIIWTSLGFTLSYHDFLNFTV